MLLGIAILVRVISRRYFPGGLGLSGYEAAWFIGIVS